MYKAVNDVISSNSLRVIGNTMLMYINPIINAIINDAKNVYPKYKIKINEHIIIARYVASAIPNSILNYKKSYIYCMKYKSGSHF